MTASTQDYFKLHFIVFLWSFTAVLGKLISIPAVEMVFYRTLLAAVGLAVLMILLRKSFSVSKTHLFAILLTSSIVAIHWITFFASGKISNPSTSLVGFATCSFWAALIEPLVKGKKIQLLEVGLGIVVLIGLVIIFTFDFQHPLGLLLGIISGLTAALFSVINSRLILRVNAYAITFYEMAGASIIILFFMSLGSVIGYMPLNLKATGMDWVYIAFMAWVCSVYAFLVSINLSTRISVFFIQLALNLEPVYGIVLALLVFGSEEVMNLNFYLGTLIILSAVVAYPLIKRRSQGRVPAQ